MASSGSHWNSGAKLYRQSETLNAKSPHSITRYTLMLNIIESSGKAPEVSIVNFSIEWYVEDQVLFVKHWGPTRADEVRLQMEMMNHQLDLSSAQSIHVIIDLSSVTRALSVKEFPKAFGSYKTHPKYRWTMMVGQKDPLVRFASTVATNLFRAPLRTFDTNEQAVEFLRSIDPEIDWTKANPLVLERPIPETAIGA